jgi:hypothetical protein
MNRNRPFMANSEPAILVQPCGSGLGSAFFSMYRTYRPIADGYAREIDLVGTMQPGRLHPVAPRRHACFLPRTQARAAGHLRPLARLLCLLPNRA